MTDPLNDQAGDQPNALEEQTITKGRRDAVTKLAYASPVLAGMLLSRPSAAQNFSPPPPPPPPKP